MVCSHDRNQPGRRRAKSEREKERGRPSRLADTEWNRDRLKRGSDDDDDDDEDDEDDEDDGQQQ